MDSLRDVLFPSKLTSITYIQSILYRQKYIDVNRHVTSCIQSQIYQNMTTYMLYTVNYVYKEPAYNELHVIRNWFSFPNIHQGTSSLYVYNELRL